MTTTNKERANFECERCGRDDIDLHLYFGEVFCTDCLDLITSREENADLNTEADSLAPAVGAQKKIENMS